MNCNFSGSGKMDYSLDSGNDLLCDQRQVSRPLRTFEALELQLVVTCVLPPAMALPQQCCPTAFSPYLGSVPQKGLE